MAFDPTQYGATPVTKGGFDPTKYGATPVQASAPSTPAKPQSFSDGLWSSLAGGLNTVFGGGKIGKGLGNDISGAIESVKQGSFKPLLDAGAENNRLAPEIFGDAAKSALTAVSPLIGGPAGSSAGAIAGRIGTSAAVGAGLGGASALADGKTAPSDVLSSAGGGALVGGAMSGAGEALNAVVQNLPNRLVRAVLPKLKPGNEQSVYDTNLGSVASMLDASKASVRNYGEQIQSILNHPDYVGHTGDGSAAIDAVLGEFKNSKYTPESIVSTVSDLVPAQSKLVDKIAEGTATLGEKNTVRQALDMITKKRFTDAPQLTASKEIAAKFADALRSEVQASSPETQPIFQSLSKELDLRNALVAANKKVQNSGKVTLYDILSFTSGGLPSLLGERFATSPAAAIATAKGLNVAAKAAPTVGALSRGVRAPIINTIEKAKQ